MNIEYLIQLMENRLKGLVLSKDQAFMSGDLERINTLDVEINNVQDTISKLKILVSASAEAATLNTNIVEAMKIPTSTITVTNGSIECLKYYDISTYATDPLHEQKISDILTTIGNMTSSADIDAYISNEAIGSPLTGQMIWNAAEAYAVDIRLMMALMELDSRFGTAGVAVETLNPGNIGNTGSSTRTYESWTLGVTAVAEWLNRHRIEIDLTDINTNTATSTPQTQATSTPTTTATSTSSTTNTSSSTTATATTTIPFIEINTNNSTTTSSSNTSTSTPETSSASTTPNIDLSNIGDQNTSTTTPASDTTATSSTTTIIQDSSVSNGNQPTPTPQATTTTESNIDGNATTTQAYDWFGRKKRV